MSNISTATLKLLNEQISHEMFNAQRYLKLGASLKNRGLDNIGDFFYVDQVNEEHGHQRKIATYITDRNEPVLAIDVPDVTTDFDSMSLTEIANFFVQAEIDTTTHLKNIASSSFMEGDLMTFNFMLEMIGYQRSEEEEAVTFQDKAKMAQDNMQFILLWDANFGD